MTMKNTTTVKDTVCGMDIETATAAGRREYKGQTYYFCGAKCKEKFDLNPEQHLGRSGTPKSGHGCVKSRGKAIRFPVSEQIPAEANLNLS
jgi:YHS domain-containing protein